jgi:hypothetical protein
MTPKQRDEIAIATALLLGTEFYSTPAPIIVTGVPHWHWYYQAVLHSDVPTGHGDRAPCRIGCWPSKGDAARAFLSRRGFYQDMATGVVQPDK